MIRALHIKMSGIWRAFLKSSKPELNVLTIQLKRLEKSHRVIKNIIY